MTPIETIQKQLADPSLAFVKLRGDVFCELAEKCKPKEDSSDEVEISMARTVRIHKGGHVEMLNVHPKVAERLVAVNSPKVEPPKKDQGK